MKENEETHKMINESLALWLECCGPNRFVKYLALTDIRHSNVDCDLFPDVKS